MGIPLGVSLTIITRVVLCIYVGGIPPEIPMRSTGDSSGSSTENSSRRYNGTPKLIPINISSGHPIMA